MKIRVTEDGPYVVRGGVPLVRAEIVTNEAGESVAWREIEKIETEPTYRLCRCGSSANKPFCDMTHVIEEFDGAETAARDPYFETAASVDGPGLRLRDVRHLCAEARFCDRAGGLWNLVERADDPDVRALVEEEAGQCPSGRYVVCHTTEDGDSPCEPGLEPSIVLVEDPHLGVSGPLWVRGGIRIIGSDGAEYEARNRVTLCRCGSSANKPFCDGSHIEIEFRDDSNGSR